MSKIKSRGRLAFSNLFIAFMDLLQYNYEAVTKRRNAENFLRKCGNFFFSKIYKKKRKFFSGNLFAEMRKYFQQNS